MSHWYIEYTADLHSRGSSSCFLPLKATVVLDGKLLRELEHLRVREEARGNERPPTAPLSCKSATARLLHDDEIIVWKDTQNWVALNYRERTQLAWRFSSIGLSF